MENFFKGILWGTLIGTCVGAIVVAKNKKLSVKIKEGVEMAEEKIKETKQTIEDKFNDGVCNCLSKNSSYEEDESFEEENNQECKTSNNKFLKKNKNC